MDNLIALIGLLFFIGCQCGSHPGSICGALERLGVTWAKGKKPLDDALKLASEFAPKDTDLYTKLQAVKSVAKQVEETAQNKLSALENIEEQRKGSGSEAKISQIAADINAIAAEVKKDLQPFYKFSDSIRFRQ